MDEPIFYKAERFFPNEKYEEFSKIHGRVEIVTHDCCLCRVIIDEHLFGDMEIESIYAGEVKSIEKLLKSPLGESEQIIAYYKNPIENHTHHKLKDGFEFCGYDLSEEMTHISAITNCDDFFDKAIPYEKLNKFGLICEHQEALRIRELLGELYPDEEHAECEVYELWRKL